MVGSENKSIALSDRMVESIREAILRGRLHPGEHLSQSQLAEQYSVSKVPVREALRQLHAEQLLHHDRYRGYFVARTSRSEARQLYQLRHWIEAELLRTARWPDAAEIAELRKLQAIVTEPINSANREEWNKALVDMRFRIFDLSPEKILLREAKRLWMLTDRFRALLPPDRSPSGESPVIDALEFRDRTMLLKAFEEDRQRIEAMVEDTLASISAVWNEEPDPAAGS